MFRTGLAIAFWFVLTAGAAPIYKWVDEDGKVHYSDQPRPQVKKSEELMPTSAPGGDDVRVAEETLNRLVASQQTTQEIESAAPAVQNRAQRELDQARRVDRQEQCTEFQSYLHTLKLKMPGYVLNENGDSVFLDAEKQAAEIDRSLAEINKFCD